MKVAIYTNLDRDNNGEFALKFYKELVKQGADAYIILKNNQILDNVKIGTFQDTYDLLITIGGDGTTLEGVQGTYKNNTNVIAINAGHLGFLSEFSTKKEFSIKETVSKLLNNQYEIDKRLMLETKSQDIKMIAANDIVIQRNKSLHAIKIEVYIDGVKADEYKGDGAIVSTPTGSTAYSLSCQGPVLSPNLDAYLIVAICPHILHGRPIVVNANQTVRIKAYSEEDIIVVACDGQVLTTQPSNSVDITIEKSKFTYNKITFENNNNFYNTLLKKLNYQN